MREVETREAWAQVLREGATEGIAVQSLDLEAETAQILAHGFLGSLFLGCTLSEIATLHITAHGGTVLPRFEGLPFNAFPNRLYTPASLFAGFDPADPASYAETPDAEIYAWWKDTGRMASDTIRVSLARRLHDHGITDALHELIDGRKVVALMGGHGLERASTTYRDAAVIARALTRDGYLLASGGGPGAMEATHLGAWFAPRPDAELDAALAVLAPRPPGSTPGTEYADPDWLTRAWNVRTRWPLEDPTQATSLGIPTWHYGHEPPNAFATHHAKYFANSVREEGLLTIATYGVVFAPGSAGTIQEVFQDAAQNHYGSIGVISPMVFLGTSYWTEVKPVYPLLSSLAASRPYGELLSITDDPQAVIETIRAERRIPAS